MTDSNSYIKLIYLGLSVFFFLHAIRDVLQIWKVKNWFTIIGHFYDNPRYELPSAIVSLILGTVFSYLTLR